jgi:cysteamine dioxygenase
MTSTTSSKLQNLLNLSLKLLNPVNKNSIKDYLTKINLNDEIDLTFISEANKLLNEFSLFKIQTGQYKRLLRVFLKEKEKNYDKNKFFNISMYAQSDAPVLHMEIYEKRSLVSLTLFLIRKGYRIPLHNHPNMFGLIKILHGHGVVSSYTVDDKQQINDNGVVIGKHEFTKCVNAGDLLTVEANFCNVHEIVASKDSDIVFMDLIVPPYDGNCNYYQVLKESDGLVYFKLLDKNPDDYFCDSIIYSGPKLVI